MSLYLDAMCKVHGPVKSLRFYRPTLRKLRFQRSRGAALRDMRACMERHAGGRITGENQLD